MLRLEIPALFLCGAATSRSSSSSMIFRRSSSLCVSSYSKPHHHQQQLQIHYHRHSKPLLEVCNNSQSKAGDHELHEHSDDDDYLKAVLLMTETIRFHQLYLEHQMYLEHEIDCRHYTKLFPLSEKMEELLGLYETTTIFLKVFNDCDGDCLLPIAVGEGVVERLIRLLLAEEVKWVHITKRVDSLDLGNANICFHKPGAEDIKVDARLSDAIILGKQCGSPIYVSKQIVQRYGVKLENKSTGILRDKESIYEVYLDSAIDGPDILAEEFDLVSKMHLSVKEERYTDADCNGYLTALEVLEKAISEAKNKDRLVKDADKWPEKFSKRLPSIGVGGTPKLKIYDLDFGWGKPKNYEDISIDYGCEIPINALRITRKDIEIGVSFSAKQMNAILKLSC